jgi:hypothetical protein
MAGITVESAEAKLSEYLAAETKILSGQSCTFNGRMLTMANLAEVQKGIEIWNKRVQKLSRGGLSMKFGTPS